MKEIFPLEIYDSSYPFLALTCSLLSLLLSLLNRKSYFHRFQIFPPLRRTSNCCCPWNCCHKFMKKKNLRELSRLPKFSFSGILLVHSSMVLASAISFPSVPCVCFLVQAERYCHMRKRQTWRSRPKGL